MTHTDFTETHFQTLHTREARLRALWEMTPSERIVAMRRGELPLDE